MRTAEGGGLSLIRIRFTGAPMDARKHHGRTRLRGLGAGRPRLVRILPEGQRHRTGDPGAKFEASPEALDLTRRVLRYQGRLPNREGDQ